MSSSRGTSLIARFFLNLGISPNLGGTILGGPCNKNYSILGSKSGFPYFGKLPFQRSGFPPVWTAPHVVRIVRCFNCPKKDQGLKTLRRSVAWPFFGTVFECPRRRAWAFREIRRTLFGVPIIRTTVLWDLYSGPPI